MERIFALLLALVMCLSLAACGGGDEDKTPSSDNTPSSSSQQEQQPSNTPDPDTSEPDETSDMPDESSELSDDGEEDWTDFFSLPGLATPDGFTVTSQKWSGDEPRICNVNFEKSGGFTEEEINAFAQMLWDSCMEVSPDGIYELAYVDGKPAAGTAYTSISDAQDTTYGAFNWSYTHSDYVMNIQISYENPENGTLHLGRTKNY